MIMEKYPAGKWTTCGCERWISYFGTAMKMDIHSEREREGDMPKRKYDEVAWKK